MKKLVAFLLLLVGVVAPSQAVLKEKTLPKSLSVLKSELKRDYDEQQKMMARFQMMNKQQHQQILDVMQRSNQIGLMLYSQQSDYTFDLAYACHEATDLYNNFAFSRKPFNTIVTWMQTEIDRYTRLIASLEKLPPMTAAGRAEMFKGMSADSVKKIMAERKNAKPDSAMMAKMKEYMLDEKGQADRDSCLKYAYGMLEDCKSLLASVEKDNEHYERVQNRLKEAHDYATKRYEKLQQDIFVDGGPSYVSLMSMLPFYGSKAVNEIKEKYVDPDGVFKNSDWNSKIVFGLLLFVCFYLIIAGVVAFSLVKFGLKFLKKRAANNKLKTNFFKSIAGMGKNKEVCTSLALTIILFAVALMFAISFMNHNFLVMACKLLIEYAWLLGVILMSLLVRLNNDYIKGGFVLYTPMMLMGFIIICMRIVFIPNDVLNLIFPILLIIFVAFQWWSNRIFRKNNEKIIRKNAERDALEMMEDELEDDHQSWEVAYKKHLKEVEDNKKGILVSDDEDGEADDFPEYYEPKYVFSKDDKYVADAHFTEKQLEDKIKATQEKLSEKVAACHRKEEKLTHSDVLYAWISFFIMLASMFISLKGYTFLALQIFIWWLFQLTCIHTITSLFDLINKGEENFLKGKMKRAAYELDCKIKGVEYAKNKKYVIDLSDMKERSKFITQTWFFDLLHICVVPVLATLSVIFSILWAADVFNLTEFCKTIFFTNFIDVPDVIQLSIFKIVLAMALFFIFKFINYLIKAIFQHIAVNRNVRNGDSSASMFNNFSSLLVWGIYFIILLSLLQVPKSGISLVTAGLATGIGFAMKDLLENLFYGISLMSGRLRVGEWIECDGVRGKVVNMGYQSTSIATLDGYIISFLNASLFTKNFKNLTRNHEYEFLPLTIGIAYGSNIQKARDVITEAVRSCNRKLDDGRNSIDLAKGVKVIVSNLNESSVDLYVSLWTDVAKKYWVKGRCLEAIYDALNEAGIAIPFPQQDVHIIKD